MIGKPAHIKKKLVANARAIITLQVSLPLGITKMEQLALLLQSSEEQNPVELSIFSEARSEIYNYPLFSERLLYNKEYLIAEDHQLHATLEKYREPIMYKCFEIIKEFTGTTKWDKSG